MKMKIAATYEDGFIYQHFGHTQEFKVYEIEDGMVKNSMVVGNGGFGHEALAELLSSGDIEILICGGIGPGAQIALAEYGIKVVPGISGSADAAVEAFLKGELEFSTEANCNHHDGEHNCSH